MSVRRTVQEYTVRRKIGGGSYSAFPLSAHSAISPHKCYYGHDQNGNEVYFIEFNIDGFKFEDVTISTNEKQLTVKGQTSIGEGLAELNKDFTREFSIPEDVDSKSIKASLDAKTNMLTLVGQIKAKENMNVFFNAPPPRLGTIRESKKGNLVEYEIYVGEVLANGQCKLDLADGRNLKILVFKKEFDDYGEQNYELKREIKLPSYVEMRNIKHVIDRDASNLHIKVYY